MRASWDAAYVRRAWRVWKNQFRSGPIPTEQTLDSLCTAVTALQGLSPKNQMGRAESPFELVTEDREWSASPNTTSTSLLSRLQYNNLNGIPWEFDDNESLDSESDSDQGKEDTLS